MMEVRFLLITSVLLALLYVTGTYAVAECNSNPCRNGAACLQEADHYVCICVDNYVGTNCDDTFDGDTQCGKNFDMTSGTILSQNFPDNYLPNSRCVYLVRIVNAPKIKFTFNKLRLEAHKDFLEIGGGGTPSYGGGREKFTGTNNTLPKDVVINDRQAWLLFYSDMNGQDEGFSIDYTGDLNACDPNSCQNGAACIDGDFTYRCICPPGYIGDNCAYNFDECSSDPCTDGALCTDGVNGYSCTCHVGWSGPECKTKYCNSNPCQNGAACVEGADHYICICQQYFVGDNCDGTVAGNTDCGRNFDAVSGTIESLHPYEPMSRCVYLIRVVNAKSITFTITTFHLEANKDYLAIGEGGTPPDQPRPPTQFTGTYYDLPIEKIINGRQAWMIFDSDLNMEFRGFSINYIADIDDCLGSPCQNNGTCTDQVDQFTCTCAVGWTGTYCEYNEECVSGVCLNSAKRGDVVNGYHRICVLVVWLFLYCQTFA